MIFCNFPRGGPKKRKKKKSCTPTLQKWLFLRKITKKYVYPILGQKNTQLGAVQCSKISYSWILANLMRITKLFSKLTLVKNWQFGRGNVKRCRPKIKNIFLFSHTISHFLVKLDCMSFVTKIFHSKFPIQRHF